MDHLSGMPRVPAYLPQLCTLVVLFFNSEFENFPMFAAGWLRYGTGQLRVVEYVIVYLC